MAGMTSTAPTAPPRGNAAYLRFAERLRARERYEPPPRSRGKEKLAGMLSLLERLDHPERHFRVVHVAGTNGKGMTAAMVAGLLAAGGARVGIYTSPHLMDVRERIVLDGLPIAEVEFQEIGDIVLDIAEEMGGEPYFSYFDRHCLFTPCFFIWYRLISFTLQVRIKAFIYNVFQLFTIPICSSL